MCTGWGDGGNGGGIGKVVGGMRGSGEWGEDGGGAMVAGWPSVGDSRGRTVSRVTTPGTPGAQWASPNKDGWGKKVNIIITCGVIHVYILCVLCMSIVVYYITAGVYT